MAGRGGIRRRENFASPTGFEIVGIAKNPAGFFDIPRPKFAKNRRDLEAGAGFFVSLNTP